MIQLLINLHDDGSIQIQGGALKDRILAYGLIELAKDAIKDYFDAKAQPAVVPATELDLRRLKSTNGGG